MSKVTYTSKWGRVHKIKNKTGTPAKSALDVVRAIKEEEQKRSGADYREKALALFGLICARCGREFDDTNRQLLTVHHIDGNHENNPPDGSNWMNLCAYCHEDIHSRGILADYFEETAAGRTEWDVVYGEGKTGGMGSLADKLRRALRDKEGQET